MSTTRKQIAEAVRLRTGDRVEVVKIEGVYYWTIPDTHPADQPHPVDRFEETCLHVCRLDRRPGWYVKDYVSRLQ
jgi:hypothetical protein